jgi:hypothetical protein
MLVGIGGKGAAVAEVVFHFYVPMIHQEHQHGAEQGLDHLLRLTAAEAVDGAEVRAAHPGQPHKMNILT